MADDNSTTASSEASDVDILAEGADDDVTEAPTEVSEGESEETPDEPTADDETEEEPEESEEVETKSLDEEETDEDEEEIARPSWKEITEKYPEIAKNKDFREMYHREKAYSEIYPTVADARDAAEKAGVFDSMDAEIVDGKIGVIFQNIRPEVLTRVAENILPALYEASQSDFIRATRPLLIDIFHNLSEKANTLDEKSRNNLKLSIENISKQLFGDFKLPDRVTGKKDPEIEREREELKRERANSAQAKRQEFLATNDKSIKRQLNDALMEGMDPQNKLTPFVKQQIIKQVLDETRDQLKNDPQFVSRMQHLLRLAERAGYTADYKPRIISAYLGRAKQIALGLRAKYKAAAIGRRVPVNKNRIESTRPSERVAQNNNGMGKGKVDYRKMSDLDIINS